MQYLLLNNICRDIIVKLEGLGDGMPQEHQGKLEPSNKHVPLRKVVLRDPVSTDVVVSEVVSKMKEPQGKMEAMNLTKVQVPNHKGLPVNMVMGDMGPEVSSNKDPGE